MAMKIQFLFAILSCVAVALSESKVPVKVYYESLCPDSISFIVKQLYPTLQHENIAKHIDLELIPYGKATQQYTDGWQFQCHHGPNECYGNLVQACALSQLPRNESSSNAYNKGTVGFINCLMSQVNRDAKPFTYPTKQCADANNINNVADIEKCANSSSGADALAKLGQITHALKPELKTVPTVVFDNVYSEEEQSLALTNFQKAVCKHIRDDVAECKSNGAITMSPTQVVLGASILIGLTLKNVI